MEIIKTYKPGQDGSKRYVQKYGEQLCAVRYRRSPCKRTVYTTVEIIVAQRDAYQRQDRERGNSKWVALKIGQKELTLRGEVKRIGGRWSRVAKVWVVQRSLAQSANLDHRIVEGLVTSCTDIPTWD